MSSRLQRIVNGITQRDLNIWRPSLLDALTPEVLTQEGQQPSRTKTRPPPRHPVLLIVCRRCCMPASQRQDCVSKMYGPPPTDVRETSRVRTVGAD